MSDRPLLLDEDEPFEPLDHDQIDEAIDNIEDEWFAGFIRQNLAEVRQLRAQLASVWAEVERWDQSHVSSSSLRQMVRDLLAIRDRAESSSPSEEQPG